MIALFGKILARTVVLQISILLLIFSLSALAVSSCDEAIEEARDPQCNGYRMKKIRECYQRHEARLRKFCIEDNPDRIAADKKWSEIEGMLLSMYEGESIPLEYQISGDVQNLEVLNQLLEEYVEGLKAIEDELPNLLAEIKGEGEAKLIDYEIYVEELVDNISNLNDLQELFDTKVELAQYNVDLLDSFFLYQRSINKLVSKVSNLENEFSSEISAITYGSQFQGRLSQTKDLLGNLSSVLSWIYDRQYTIKETTEEVVSALDHKISSIKIQKASDLNASEKSTSVRIAKEAVFASRVESTVQRFVKVKLASVTRLPFLHDKLSAAKEIVKLSQLCDADNNDTSWMRIGCKRIYQYKANAERILGRSTSMLLQASLRTLQSKVTEDTAETLKNLRVSIESGNIEESVVIYDGLLEALEANNE